MKRTGLLPLFLLLFVTNRVPAQVTAVPNSLTFQGRLATPNGNPIPDGTYSIRFSLYDALSAGTEKWNTTLPSVQVKNGTFAVPLSGFPANTFDGNLWLEIQVGTDAPLTPRTPLVSVPYAMKSNMALTVPDGSLTTSKFAPGVLDTLGWLLGGNAGINPASQFLGTTDGQPLVFRTNNVERMRLDNVGNVGIGTVAPNGLLEVVGTVATGAAMLDQAQTAQDGTASGTDQWQSFTAAQSGVLTQIDFYATSSAPSTPGTISIYAGEGTSGTLLTTQSVLWETAFIFSSHPLQNQPTVVAGQKYTIRVKSSGSDFWVGFTMGNSYGNGRASRDPGQDYMFRTYVASTAQAALFRVQNGGGVSVGSTLNMSGSLNAPTATIPTFTGNTTFSNNIAVSGTAIFNGNVGIGTVNPAQPLSVAGIIEATTGGFKFPDGTIQATAAVGVNSTAGGDLTGTYPNPTIGAGKVDNTRLTNDAASLLKVSGGAINALAGGNIGIGTGSPGQKLSVAGMVESLTGGFKFPDGSTQTTAATTLSTAGGDLTGTYPNPSLAINPASLAKVSGNLMFSDGQSIGIGITPSDAVLDITKLSASDGRSVLRLLGGGSQINSQVNLDMSTYNPGGGGLPTARIAATDDGSQSSHLDFYTKVPGSSGNALSPRMRIMANGRIGIGTQNPGQRLTVVGTIESISGGFKFPDGTTQTTAANANGAAGGDLTGNYPNPTIGAAKVDSGKLADNAVTNAKIAGGAVTTPKLGNGAVTDAILADNAVTAAKISINAVTSTKLASDGAGLAKVSGGAISASGVHVSVSGNAGAFQMIARDDVTVGSDGAAGGSLANGVLRFGSTGSGEGIGSKRTSSGNQFGLDFYTASASRMSITSTGNVGIGTAAPAAPLEIRNGGNLTSLQFRPGTLFGAGQPNAVTLDIPGAAGTLGVWDNLRVNGSVSGVGSYQNISDARYKTNVATFDNALDTILNLRGVSFDWKQNEFKEMNFGAGRQIGFIAQEVEKILPELVDTDEKGFKSVAYANVVPVLVEAVKTLHQNNAAKEKRLSAIETENAELKRQMSELVAIVRQMQTEKGVVPRNRPHPK